MFPTSMNNIHLGVSTLDKYMPIINSVVFVLISNVYMHLTVTM